MPQAVVYGLPHRESEVYQEKASSIGRYQRGKYWKIKSWIWDLLEKLRW